MVYLRIGVLTALILAGTSGFSQKGGMNQQQVGAPNLLSCSPAPCVLPTVQASEGGLPVNDAPIVADPSKPKHLLLGSNDTNCFNEGTELSFHLSSDAGSNWNWFCLPGVFIDGIQYTTGKGPIVGYDRNGVAYIGGPYGSANSAFEGFSKSSDGVDWTPPAPALSRADWAPVYCWMAVDTSMSSPYLNSVYVACALYGPLRNEYMNQLVVSRSNDGGNTWTMMDVAPIEDAPKGQDNVNMTIGKDGTLYVTWLFCDSKPICEATTAYMLFSKSGDGGNTWSRPRLVNTVTMAPNGYIPNTHVFVTNIPAIAVDNSDGAHAGNLYVVMYNWTGSFLQVLVVRSVDGGNTWSKPVPVAPGITHDQFFPWISVSPTGLVGVSWLDRRNDPANISYQAFAGISADAGLSFRPNVELTPNFSNPTKGTIDYMGDYTGNTWDGPDYFLAAWMDNSEPRMYMQDVVGGIELK